MPKIYFHDTGLLCNLLGIKSVDDLNGHFAYGNIFENFVINEFLKNQCNKGEKKNLYFLRDSKGHEIDCHIPLLEKNILYEIKSAATFNKSFVDNILYYKNKISKADGTVIYNGNSSFEFREVKVWSFEYMELDECSLMVLEKIEHDLMAGKIQSVDKTYVELEVSKLTVTEKVKNDVIRFVKDRIQIRKKVVSQKSGWWRNSNDESMEEKFKDYYHDKEYIDIDELCDVTNYIPVSNISGNERIFMRKVLSHWDATKGYLNKLINERKIQIDEKEIFIPSLVQKDTIDEFVRSGYLNADFMNFLSKKYRGKKLLD